MLLTLRSLAFATAAWGLSVTGASAQDIDLGISLGFAGYEGDLSATSFLDRVEQLRRSLGVYGRATVSEGIAVKAYVQHQQIGGADALRPSSQARNLSFESDIFEIGVAAEWYPFRVSLPAQPYVSVGASVYSFNPTTEYNGRTVALQPLGTEGQGLPGFEEKYGLTRFAIPFGAGITKPIGYSFVLGAEFSTRMLFFDHLDDVSGDYVNYNTLLDGTGIDGSGGSGPVTAALADRAHELDGTEPRDLPTGRQRGNALNNDWYYTATITLGYRIGSGLLNGGGTRRDMSRYNRCYSF